jgi:hypothetical protein
MADENTDMLAPSGDYRAMAAYWQKVETILGGSEAMRSAGEKYLPKFAAETDKSYEHRRKNAKFVNIFSDIVENIASKPFTQEVALVDQSANEAINVIAEDVDRAGNHLHVFASELFLSGLYNAIDWIFVDHTRVPEGATLADERAMGSRPFWVRVAATDMLAVYSDIIAGEEQIVYARMNERFVQRNGTGEETVQRVRVLIRDKQDDGAYAPARFELWQKDSKGSGWTQIDGGPISIGVIALVPFLTGRRKPGTWQIRPPMQDIADLQIEHYQQETNLKMAKELTAFPMFKAEGVDPPEDGKSLPLGPSTILYAPPNNEGAHGTWDILEISATSLKFLAEQVTVIEHQMRELGRQPLMSGTAGLTQVAAAYASQKASSAIQAWAFNLKDALEKAFRFTSKWLGLDNYEPTIFVNTDFAIELGAEKAPEVLMQMNAEGKLSTETLWQEMKRRSILSPEFEAEAEAQRLLAELPGDDAEDQSAAII